MRSRRPLPTRKGWDGFADFPQAAEARRAHPGAGSQVEFTEKLPHGHAVVPGNALQNARQSLHFTRIDPRFGTTS